MATRNKNSKPTSSPKAQPSKPAAEKVAAEPKKPAAKQATGTKAATPNKGGVNAAPAKPVTQEKMATGIDAKLAQVTEAPKAEPKPAKEPEAPKAEVKAAPAPAKAEPKPAPKEEKPVSLLADFPPKPAKAEPVATAAARISFLAGWRTDLHGDVLAGEKLSLEYAPERAPTFGGPAGWGVQAYVLVTPGGKLVDGPVVENGKAVPFTVDIAPEAAEVQVWFRNWTPDSSQQVWDSNFGHNYRFPVKK